MNTIQQKVTATNNKGVRGINQTQTQNSNTINPNKKAYMIASGLCTAALVGAVIINKGRTNISANITELKKLSEAQKRNYPKDIAYKNRLLSAIGLTPKDDYKLTSIIGVQEFENNVKEFEKNSKIYTPGKKLFNENGETIGFTKENTDNLEFGANFHLHTINSDGTLTVPELLDKAAEYADKRMEKHKKPFIFAITDHDTVNGCKEAVNIIKDDPYKYRNIKLVLGIENSTKFSHPETLSEPGSIHVLSYGINPYATDLDNFLGTRVRKSENNIKKAINGANSKFSGLQQKYGFDYSFDEIAEITPCLKGGIKDANYLAKDYFQFKMIYADAVTKNDGLNNFLKENSVDMKEYKFYNAISKIPKNPDCSNGKAYWGYYFDALKNDVAEYAQTKNPNIKTEDITSKFKPISEDVKSAMYEIEGGCFNPNSEIFVATNEFPELGNAVSKLNKLEDGEIGIAHPGVLFPYKAIKDRNKLPNLYDSIYQSFKQNGGDRAKYAEDYYQVYYKNNLDEPYQKLPEISKKYGLLKTGGLDTHSKDIFSI